jgi:hypothetical protein
VGPGEVPSKALKYRENFYSLDEFTALHFTAVGAPPAARLMRILPMNQHA